MRLVLTLVAFATAFPAIAQDRRPRDPNEIVVEGLLVPGDKPASELRQATTGGVKNRINYENSLRIAKCAMRLPLDRLKQSIDGAPNSAPQREAQSYLVRLTAACNADPGVTSQRTPGGSIRALTNIRTGGDGIMNVMVGYGMPQTAQERSADGISIYDYGAFLETAIKRFAPGISLTRRETGDPAVQARFDAREVPLNKYRLPTDRRYFEVAVCMVRLQPELSTRLFNSKPGSDLQRRLQATIINNARVCVGNARGVYVDPTQFRIYISDALYRWVLAARGLPSLIPDHVATASR